MIRADDQESFQKAFIRIGHLLQTFARPEQDVAGRQILIEDFIPGIEVALEGLLTKNMLHPWPCLINLIHSTVPILKKRFM